MHYVQLGNRWINLDQVIEITDELGRLRLFYARGGWTYVDGIEGDMLCKYLATISIDASKPAPIPVAPPPPPPAPSAPAGSLTADDAAAGVDPDYRVFRSRGGTLSYSDWMNACVQLDQYHENPEDWFLNADNMQLVIDLEKKLFI